MTLNSNPTNANSPEPPADLERLRQAIELAIADGVFDRAERDRITAIMRADHKITLEELTLIRTLIGEKVERGELTLDYS